MKRFPTVVVRGEILSSWLAVSDYTRSRLAIELGISKGRVSQLLTSREEPSAHLIAKLILLTQLPFERLFKIVRDLSLASSISGSSVRRRRSSMTASSLAAESS